MRYSINVQGICDEKGLFLDVDASWPGSTHDAKVYKNSIINNMFQSNTFPGESHILVENLDSVPPLLIIGDPAYPLLPNVMKEYSSCFSNDEVLFNEMLRSTRAFGRLKARWRILMRPIDIDIQHVPSLIHTYFILHNYCEMKNISIPEKQVQRIINQERRDQNCEHHRREDPTYTYATKNGEMIRDIVKTYFGLH